MFELTLRQRLAALILLFFLALGGAVLYLEGNGQRYHEISTADAVVPLRVHICGAVARPGVFTIKPATRVVEALKLAGGSLPEADLNQINLAAMVEDGEQIYVPQKGEILMTKKRSSRFKKITLAAAASSKTTPALKWPVDLNLTTQNQLEAVPGIGPVLAQRILEYRKQHGNFASYEDLGKVVGIGPQKLIQFRPYLYVK